MEIIQTPRGFEKASDKLTSEQLDRPIDEVVAGSPAESVPETTIEPEIKPEAVAEEEKVPKSRFLTMHQRAVEAEKALRAFEAERAERPETVTPVTDDADLKKFYTDTFGESELSDKLYKNELARLTSIEERAAERAYERLSQREQVEQEVIEQRVQNFDAAFEELATVEGKTEFSDDEQVAILDIVEQYSPKDTNGKFLGEYLLPLDKAYEIYQLQSETKTAPKKIERNAIAALQGTRSQGAPSAGSDSDWKPGQRGRWENKLPK